MKNGFMSGKNGTIFKKKCMLYPWAYAEFHFFGIQGEPEGRSQIFIKNRGYFSTNTSCKFEYFSTIWMLTTRLSAQNCKKANSRFFDNFQRKFRQFLQFTVFCICLQFFRFLEFSLKFGTFVICGLRGQLPVPLPTPMAPFKLCIHMPNTSCLQVILWIFFLLFLFFWSVKQLMSTYLSCTRPTETKLMIIQPTKQKQKMKHVENKRIALPLDIFFSSLCIFPRTLAPFVISCNIYGKRREKAFRWEQQ